LGVGAGAPPPHPQPPNPQSPIPNPQSPEKIFFLLKIIFIIFLFKLLIL